MNQELTVTKSIEIKGTAEIVWDAMTNPDKIALYLYGTKTETDWKVGSAISFTGEMQGHPYHDKGRVTINNKPKLLSYKYWSSFSGLEDKPENYFNVTYKIEVISNELTKLTWHQVGFSNEKGKEHTEIGLPNMLNAIKQICEQ